MRRFNSKIYSPVIPDQNWGVEGNEISKIMEWEHKETNVNVFWEIISIIKTRQGEFFEDESNWGRNIS